MNHLFGILAIASGIAIVIGFAGMTVSVAFDQWDWDWPVKPFALGIVGVLLFGAGYYFTQPPSPLSRGVVADKQHRSYTMMVMVGKVFVPQHIEVWELVSAEGAKCEVTPDSYENYHVGDAVVCAWKS